MPGQVIGTELGLGYAGGYARTPDRVVMSRPVKTAAIPFGTAVVLNDDNTYSPFGAAGTLAKFAGFAVREVKQSTSYLTQGNPEYAVGQHADVLERGNVTVVCNAVGGNPVSGGKVYIATAAGTGVAVGDLVTVASQGSSTTIELTNCRWATGKISSDGLTELCILTRNNP